MAIDAFGLKRLQKVLKKLTKPLTKDELNELGEMIVKRMKRTIRLGKSPATGRNFKRLSKPYIKERKKFRRRLYDLSTFFSANKSNLHVSGQLIDAIFFRVEVGNGSVLFGVLGSKRKAYHPRLKTPRITNAEIAAIQEFGGRPFVDIDKVGLTSVIGFILRKIEKAKKR